jgi:nucleoside-diphosphate-sugar epimerase
MTNIAVTGSRGFVGSHLCADLRARGHCVIEIERQQLNSSELAETLRETEVVVHLAARAHAVTGSKSNLEATLQAANIDLTRSIARGAARAGVRRLIFLSSAGVLGRSSPTGKGFTDQSSHAPFNAYTRSKLEAEEWLRSGSESPPEIVILRAPLIYGPGAPGNFARLLKGVMSGWPLPIGNLDAPRSLVGIRNLVDLINLTVSHAAAADATMLVADREITTFAQFAEEISRQLGLHPRQFSVPKPLLFTILRILGKSDDIARLSEPFVLSPSAAKARLGWTPPHSQSEELNWTISCTRKRRYSEA